MDTETALRPSQPADPEAQLRWLIARQTEAMLQVVVAVQQLTATVGELRQLVSVLVARGPAE